jgi:two-component system cell cycle response regulator
VEAKTDPVTETPAQTPIDASASCPVGQADCAFPVQVVRLREELEQLTLQVRTDALTGLFNYRHFSELLGQEVERSQRCGLPLALIMMDLDFFKRVNDQWGHEVGNQVLIQVADILRAGVRRIDVVCRYGGEEMVIILPGTMLSRAIEVAQRLREEIAAAHIAVAADALRITASFGVAGYPGADALDAQGLIAAADAYLYQAKNAGRNRVCHSPVPSRMRDTQVSADEKRALLE